MNKKIIEQNSSIFEREESYCWYLAYEHWSQNSWPPGYFREDLHQHIRCICPSATLLKNAPGLPCIEECILSQGPTDAVVKLVLRGVPSRTLAAPANYLGC